jgi:hypothetical protein
MISSCTTDYITEFRKQDYDIEFSAFIKYMWTFVSAHIPHVIVQREHQTVFMTSCEKKREEDVLIILPPPAAVALLLTLSAILASVKLRLVCQATTLRTDALSVVT